MSAAPSTASEICPSCHAPRKQGSRFCIYCGAGLGAAQPRAAGLRGRIGRGAAGLDGSDLLYVVLAALLAVVLSHVPIINVLIYPFKLFGTFVHEWSHALVALATGGTVVALQINPDLSGETFTAGGWGLLIASAGYTGAAIAGALLLLSPTRFAKRTLIGIGAAALLMPLLGTLSLGTSFSANTWIWALLFSAVTLAAGLFLELRLARLFQQFIAVELCLTALDSLRNLAWLSYYAPNRTTDATIADRMTHLPALLWAILWGIIALLAIGLSLRRVVRRSLA